MSVIRELADIAQRTSVLLGFNTPADLLTLLQKMREVSDPPGRVIEDVRAELHRQETEVGNTLRAILETPPSPMFPCACEGELKVTRVPCPVCVRVRYPSAAQLEGALYPNMRSKAVGIAREMVEADAQRTPLEQELAHVPRLERPTEAGPPPTHLAPMVRLSDKPPSSAAKVSSQPGDRGASTLTGRSMISVSYRRAR